MSAEWDLHVAEMRGDRATAHIISLQAEVLHLRARVDRLEVAIEARDQVIDAVTAERDAALADLLLDRAFDGPSA